MAKNHDDERRKARQPDFQPPDLARVPKLEVSDNVFSDAPLLVAKAGAITDARLRDAAKRIQDYKYNKDAPTLQRDIVTGFGTTGRGLLGLTCHSYLPENRFDWWDVKSVPKSGAIGGAIGDDNETSETDSQQVFCDEFCSPFATVTGADLDGPSHSSQARKVPWDQIAEASSPNNTPNIEFSVRTERPASVPTIVLAEVYTSDRPSTKVPQKVLINAVEEGHEIDPTQPRPPLIIDFVVPQRAVGLEFGFLGEAHRIINPDHVKLKACDRDGRVCVAANALSTVAANSVAHLIGVRDERGAISSVELSFEDPDGSIPEPQIVSRIWHEPFPPVAVHQGTVEQVVYGSPSDERNQDVTVPERPPFHCSSALLAVRGFRLEFLDDDSHEIKDFSFELFGVGATTSGQPVRISASNVFTDLDGLLEVGGRGTILAKDTQQFIPYRLKIYYTILAWDPAQMDVAFAPATVSTHGIPLQESDSFGRIVVTDPCDPHREWEPPGSNACGEVDSVIHSWRGIVYATRPSLMLPRLDQHFTSVMFWTDPPHRILGQPSSALITAEPVGLSVDVQGSSASTDTSLIWTMHSKTEGNYEGPHRWEMSGGLLTGTSVLRPFSSILDSGSSINVNLRSDIRRADREWFLTPDDVENLNLIAPMEADMAFVTVEFFNFRDMDEIQALDVEVKGETYDGSRVKWKLGFESQGYFAAAWPRFGGLVRRIRKPRTTLSKRDLRFDHANVEVITLTPDQFGLVRNEGNIPVFINELTRGGPHTREFITRFEYRGDVLSDTELANRAPLRLDPGEAVTIGGQFYTMEGEDSEHSAWLEFRTNSVETPFVHVNLSAQLVASQAEGAWIPSMHNYGNVGVGHDETRVAIIHSDGRSPLIVRSLAIQPPTGSVMRHDTGFSFTGVSATNWHQIEPGQSVELRITFAPTTAGPVEVLLIAETNAGPLELHLLGEGVDY